MIPTIALESTATTIEITATFDRCDDQCGGVKENASATAGVKPIAASIFDLYRDPREERPIESIKYGPWAGRQFAAIAKRHMAMRIKYPDREAVYDVPYGGIVKLRPETKRAVEIFVAGSPMMTRVKK